MGDAHQMIVNDVRKMVGGKTVALKQDGIRTDIAVAPGDVAHQHIMEGGLAVGGNLESDYRLDSLHFIFSSFSLAQVAAMPVIPLHFALLFLLLEADRFQTLGGAIAIICFTVTHKLLGIAAIQIKSLTLDIRAAGASHDGPFIPSNTQPGKGVVQILQGFIAVPLTVGILDSQYEFA